MPASFFHSRSNRVWFVFLALTFCACAGAPLPSVTPHMLERAGENWPGVSMERLDAARSLYVSKCSGCHNVPIPSEFTIKKWGPILDEMAIKAKLRADETEDIWRFILAAHDELPIR